MPPLRKKGRGGGGGKTEAPLPGEIPGVSPSVPASLSKKEKEKGRNGSTQAGLDNLGVLVSRSFQKEKSEKKLLETSRSSLHLTGGFSQRSLRVASRRAESASTDGTPRVAGSSSRREEKKFGDAAAAHRTGAGFKSACRGRDEPAVCRTSCRELGEEKALYRKSLRAAAAPGEEKLERRVSRRDDKTVDYSTRYNSIYPGISGGKEGRESKSVDVTSTRMYIGGSSSQRVERFEDFAQTKTSPISPAYVRKSPRHSDMMIVTSPTPAVNHPVKSSCKCGAFRSSDISSSPPTQQQQEKLGITGLGKQRGASPILMPTNTEIVRSEGKERRSRELTENGVLTPAPIPLQHSGSSSGSGGRSDTPTNVLHGRLAVLEGRVSQIAAELKATKELLDANNPACSKAVLTDIQTKIYGIERAINYRLAKECGLVEQLEAQEIRGHYITANDGSTGHPHSLEGSSKISGRGSKSVSNTDLILHGQGMYGRTSNASLNSGRALAISGNISPEITTSMSAAEKLSHIASLGLPRSKESNIYQCIDPSFVGEVGGSAPSTQVKPIFDYDEFEDRLFPHQKLLKNRPGVQQKLMENRAALQQKLLENSVLLRHKLAALEQRDGISGSSLLEDPEFGATKFITTLKHSGSKDKDVERGRCSSSESDKTCPREFAVSELGGPFSEKRINHAGESLSNQKSRGSKEGRRSSASRRSFSGTPGSRNEARFYSLDKGMGPRGASDRRRRSSEKRKSIGSPEIVTGASQIVMLEPTRKISGTSTSNKSSRSQELAIQPYQGSVEIKEVYPVCSQPSAHPDLGLADQGHINTEERATKPDPNVIPSNTSDSPLRLLCDEAVRESLACDESLTSEDTADEPECAPPGEDDEQPYLAECEDNVPSERLHQVGDKIATAGWFMGDGDAILLAHEDGCCSFYDVLNMEGKANYKGPENLAPGIWRDCWLIRAAGPDGTSNKYIVAASAGSAVDAAFCSWDFYDRRLTAYHSESLSVNPSPGTSSFRSSPSSSPERRPFTSRDNKQNAKFFSWYSGSENAQLLKGKAHNRPLSGINSGSRFDSELSDTPLWWYRPSSPLIAAVGTGLKTVTLYDVRDGDVVMRWDLGKWVAPMHFCSPIQWRNRGRLVVAEDQGLSLWDVNGMTPHPVLNINLSGKQIRAVHIRNSDAEASGGVRQRVSSRDGQAADGVVCTQDAVNILDFRAPAGIVLKIPTFGDYSHSVAVNGDLVFAGVTSSSSIPVHENAESSGIGSYKENIQAKILQWSIKQGRPMSVYKFPESSAYQAQQSVAQVWGNDSAVMGANGNGLFMFDATKGAVGKEGDQTVRETFGGDDLFQPSFDFAGSRVLLISRDRPASWCHWP